MRMSTCLRTQEISVFPQVECRFGGAVAQLVEHLLCKQGVVGSSPIRSTSREARPRRPVGHPRPPSVISR